MRGRPGPRLVTSAAVVAATAAAVVVAAAVAAPRPSSTALAARAAGPVIIPFPAPPAGESRGRLHTLPALQCRLHPATPDGVSPDPDAVVNPYGRGGTGWVLQANTTTPAVVIPYGAGTCATPLDDALQLEYLEAPRAMALEWPVSASPNVTTGGVPGAEFEWAGNGVPVRMNMVALLDKGHDGMVLGEYFRSHPCASAKQHPGLVCADEVARLLTVQRNQREGDVLRHRGLYDVLSVSRLSSGVVLNKAGNMVAAHDILTSSLENHSSVVVMYTTRDNHTRPVLVGEAALLSLGRGIMADASWLGASFPGTIHAYVVQDVYGYDSRLRTATWSLRQDNETTSSSSRWLSDIASVLCLSPSSSFVADSSLCDGVKEPPLSRPSSLRAGGRPVKNSVGVGGGHRLGSVELSTYWVLDWPVQQVSAPACPSFENIDNTTLLRQPIWLLGRGSRELHTNGPGDRETEMALLRNLSSCAFNGTRWDLSPYSGPAQEVADLTVELSQRFRRDLFRVEPPVDPVSDTGLILAALVVVPEAMAVLLLLLRRRRLSQRMFRWRWRAGLSAALVVVAGAVVLVGVGYLDRQEQEGHAWRAATVRVALHTAVNTTEQKYTHPDKIDYRGRLTWYQESLFVVARSGYRPHVTRRLFVGSVVAYAVLVVAVLVRSVVTWWQRRRRPDNDEESRAVDATPVPPSGALRTRACTAAPRALGEGDLMADDSDGGGGRGGHGSGGHVDNGGHWSLVV